MSKINSTFVPIVLAIATPAALVSTPAIAANRTLTVYASDVRVGTGSVVDLTVMPGYELTISFLYTDETIVDVSSGDPSRLTLGALGGSLCSRDRAQNSCETRTKGLRIRQINKLSFDGLPSSVDGATTLTIITEGNQGIQQYTFRLIPKTGIPRYYNVVVKPDTQRPVTTVNRSLPPPPRIIPESPEIVSSRSVTSASDEPNRTENNDRNVKPLPPPPIPKKTSISPTTKTTNPPKTSDLNTIRMANDIVYGLVVAAQKKQINYGTQTYLKVQSAIRLLRQGTSFEEVARRAKVAPSVLQQLIRWGQSRP